MKFTNMITAYANLLIRRPGAVLITVLLVAVFAGYGATKLRINTNQLDLISPKLKEVKDIRRIIDMIGGAGYLMVGVRGKDPKINKQVVNDFVKFLEADKKAKKTRALFPLQGGSGICQEPRALVRQDRRSEEHP